jgi:hypothetical protein
MVNDKSGHIGSYLMIGNDPINACKIVLLCNGDMDDDA